MLANMHRQGSFSVAVVRYSVPETGSNQLDSVIDVVQCSRLMDNLTIVRFAVSDGYIRSSHPLASLFTSFSASESIRQHASDNNCLVCSFRMTRSLYLIQHKHIERVGGSTGPSLTDRQLIVLLLIAMNQPSFYPFVSQAIYCQARYRRLAVKHRQSIHYE